MARNLTEQVREIAEVVGADLETLIPRLTWI